MSLEGRPRRDRHIRRRALQDPGFSTFSIVLGSGCDQSLIILTGFDNYSFFFFAKEI